MALVIRRPLRDQLRLVKQVICIYANCCSRVIRLNDLQATDFSQWWLTKKMAVIKRRAEAENDLTMTVGDLIREYQRNDESGQSDKGRKDLSVEQFCEGLLRGSRQSAVPK